MEERPGVGHGAVPGTLRRIARDLVVGLAMLTGASALTAQALGRSGLVIATSVALYAAHAGLILWSAPPDLPGPGFGPANRVTLLRVTLVLPVAALALTPGAPDEAMARVVILLASLSLLLDGVDGAVARRTGTSTDFGARYDMELDAFLMLALSVLVWENGRAGPWVILIGALRYLFVAAGAIWSVLRAPLPPSLRRKAVCVVQGVALVVALAPAVPEVLAIAVLAGALVLLGVSFGVDVAWLVAEERRSGADSRDVETGPSRP